MKNPLILVTGDAHGREYPQLPQAVEWVHLPTLAFEPLVVPKGTLQKALDPAPHWVIFTSPRAVHFFSRLLLEQEQDFPVETQVACIGEATAEAAVQDGFQPDYYPTEPGSEAFVTDFCTLLSNYSWKPRILLPAAEGSRTWIAEKLTEFGCTVERLATYRTLPHPDLPNVLQKADFENASLLLFTSPSAVQAIRRLRPWPSTLPVAALGEFTADSLRQIGIEPRILPHGALDRIGEIL